MKFEAEGFDVQVAENGQRGVALVEEFNPDIILLDIQMPVMDGVEALAKIRASDRGKDTPVLILTNLGEEEAPDDLKKLKVNNYIVKAEFTPKQVVAEVKQILDK